MGLKETATDVLYSAYEKASAEPYSSCSHKDFIDYVIDNTHLTYKYILFTAILSKASDESINALCLQKQSELPGAYDMEVTYVGEELAQESYPIKSFFDAGANVVFHSDYPVSPIMNVKYSFYTAETRNFPKELYGGQGRPHNLKEAITREQSLRAMTINVAHQWHQETRMGSIEVGKLANMAVFDCDFLHDDIEKVAQANIIATIVDGEEVYKA